MTTASSRDRLGHRLLVVVRPTSLCLRHRRPTLPEPICGGERFWRAIGSPPGRRWSSRKSPSASCLVALLAGGHVLDPGRPRRRARRCWPGRSVAPSAWTSRGVQGHAGPAPERHPSAASVLRGRRVPLHPRTDLHQRAARGRDQPGDAALAVGAPGGDGGAARLDRGRHARPCRDPFLVLATENPIELEGTFALPEAQLDRFLVLDRVGYPSRADEGRIARRYRESAEPLDAVTTVAPPRPAARDARSRPNRRGSARRSRTTSSTSCGRRASDPSCGWAAALARAWLSIARLRHGPTSRAGTSCCQMTSRRWSRLSWVTGSCWTSIASSAVFID